MAATCRYFLAIMNLKSTTPFDKLPVLEIDGKLYAESIPISRYLGRKYKLAGADDEEDFLIDQNVEFLNDIRHRALFSGHEQDPEARERKHKENAENHYPVMLKKLNDIIMENNGHIALSRLTWGDFVFAGVYDALKMYMRTPDLDEEYPAFNKLQESVCSLPKVKEFLDSVPASEHNF